MNNTQRDFNGVAHGLLVLSTIAVFMAIINSILQLRINSYFGTGNGAYVAEIVFDVLILAAIVFTFMKKRFGLIALTALFIVRMFATIPIGTDISYSYQLGGKMVYFFRDFGLFAIAMCFKKNGVSGWKSMLGEIKSSNDETATSESIVGENSNMPTESYEEKLEESVSSVSIAENTSSEGNAITVQPEYEGIEEQEEIPTRGKNNAGIIPFKEKFSKLPKRAKVGITGAVSIAAIVFVICIVVGVKSYPEYISSFGDKWKYTFNRPNSKLAKQLFDDAYGQRHNGAFFFKSGDKTFWRSNLSFYTNRTEILKEYKYADIYAMRDTVRSKADIDSTAAYAARWSYGQKWSIGKGQGVMRNYDDLIKEDPDIILIRIEEYDAISAERRERELVGYASLVPSKNESEIGNIAYYYEKEGNYNKAADIYALNLKYNKRSTKLYGWLAYAQFKNGEYPEARSNAEHALRLSQDNTYALTVMALLDAEDYNWGDAKKWAKKAIDYDADSSEPYFVYAEALYKAGEVKAAEEYYNKAYNMDYSDPLAEKYKECAGCPFEVIYQEFAFHKKDGEVITDYGEKLFSSKSQYISTRAKFKVLRGEKCTIQCRLYSRGKLSKGEDSGSDYTYTSDLYFYMPGEFVEEIGGWGSSQSGNWPAGNYRFEIWYNGKMIDSTPFTLY